MKLADVARFTPVPWLMTLVAVVCAVVAFCLVANGLGFKWDPFNSTDRRVERADRRADQAETAAAVARTDAAARSAEAAGAQDTTRLVEGAAADRAAATEIVHRYATQLEGPAHDPIPAPDDGADLRDVFGELCHLRPAVCANPDHAAPAGYAGDGASVVPDPAAPG